MHWELCRMAKWEVLTIAADSEEIWPPLRSSEFGQSVLPADSFAEIITFRPDVVICVKPLIESMDLARRISDIVSAPVIVDIDDPDLSASLAIGSPFRAAVKWMLYPAFMRATSARRRLAEAGSVIVSNPTLRAAHGGVMIPHAREIGVTGNAHETSAPLIAFIGTNRDHKGIPELRKVVERLHAEAGFRLIVTDDPPTDAKDWESWIGQTSFSDGMALLRSADIVALPSRRVPFARGQLPAKLMDAMFAGRAIIVSDVAPLPWAVGDAGLVFRAGRTDELYERLSRFRDPQTRAEYGRRARNRAISMFSFEALLPAYTEALKAARL
ncbi:glycosyl transferase family 1 [Rathayibacter iranicus NCPPB 2253 = VKM Ac-1602]|uniref:Glycosyl transferase family 1 n=1 Tax=Rathayibacter iranicus NCPPB 2253 = VKM Ac-1602 TaxID=1328868 RepID=A0ABX5LC39_9MICO|nr:glycosyl transferase family 1 [Rathayibacter iranicus NCPPB 2253 = VKM Ac-1602]